ncbi:MAG: L-lactate permease [Anaerovoracaceae bacterium]|jgi:lactate permease
MMSQLGFLDVILSVLPIFIFVFLLMKVKMSSAKASIISLIIAILVGYFYLNSEIEILFRECVKGLWNGFTIFTVIFPAILIYEILLKANLFHAIKVKVEGIIQDDLLRILFIGWAFTSFLQSITGFGVPVAVAAPILVSLGVSPIKSVIICILGHAWGGTFGTLAIAWDSLFLQIPPESIDGNITFYTCLMLWIYNLICGLTICFIYKKNNIHFKDIAIVFIISAVQGGGQLLFAQQNTSIACFIGSTLSILVILIINQLFYVKKNSDKIWNKEIAILHLVFPFAVLTFLIIVFLFIEPVYLFLNHWKVGIYIPDNIGDTILYSPISIFTHSGTLLFIASIISLLFYNFKGFLQKGDIINTFYHSLMKSSFVIVPVLFLIMMSKVMDGTGQTIIIANSAANLLGTKYPILSPFIGVLGAFISSSNMSSNILFAGFQNHVAELLNIKSAAILAAQTTGGSIGNLMATSNIVLGLTTIGQMGKEGEVLKRMVPIVILSGLFCGFITYIIGKAV